MPLRKAVRLAVWFLQGWTYGSACLLSACWTLNAADWPRLGGIEGRGFSSEAALSREWGPEGPPVAWSVEVGEGFAGPAVQGGEVFLLDRVANQMDVLRCFDLNTGRELWRFEYEAPGTLPYNGSRNIPTVDGSQVFTIGPFGHFHCVDRRSHRPVWKAHLVDDFRTCKADLEEHVLTRRQQLARTQVPRWGYVQAPLVYRDFVIVAPQTEETGLAAYEIGTGKVRWRSGYIGRNWFSYVSPYLTSLKGVEQVIMLAQPSDPEKAPEDAPPAIVSSVDPQTGNVLWTTKTPGPHKIPIAQPVRVGDDRLFITGGYTFGCAMLQVSRAVDAWETKFLFRNRTVAAHIQSPILYRNGIYVTSLKEQGGAATGLVCLSPDGDVVWQTGPALQFESGSLLIADGAALVIHGKTGELYMLELEASAPKLVGKAKVLAAKGANVWAPMALSDGRLLVRDQHELRCLDLRKSH